MAKPPALRKINDNYLYNDDENPDGKRDAALVSCTQCKDYSEVQKYLR